MSCRIPGVLEIPGLSSRGIDRPPRQIIVDEPRKRLSHLVWVVQRTVAYIPRSIETTGRAAMYTVWMRRWYAAFDSWEWNGSFEPSD